MEHVTSSLNPSLPVAERLARLVSPGAAAWTLRIGAFLCFVGHGAFGVLTKEAWIPYFGVVGIGREAALRLMPLVGTLDIVVGCLMLVRPGIAVGAWMFAWALWTASLRPMAGEPVWEMLERAGNYGVPLAIVLVLSAPRPRLTPARVLTATVALLLVGHGALGIMAKPLLVTNWAALVGVGTARWVTPVIGWLEIALACAVVMRPRPGVLLPVLAWKLATESLFLLAGASTLEFIERGGSYAAPLALAMLVALRQSAARISRRVSPRE